MLRRAQHQWSATGAARAARECKASIIGFLEHSDVAVGRKAHAMDTSYRALRRLHGGNKAAALVVQKAGLPLTEAPAPDWRAHARQVVDREVQVLRTAPTYVMAPSMCDVTAAAAQTLTIADLALIDEADPPTAEGFLLLPHQLPSDDGTGLIHLRALSWSTEHAWYRDDAAPDGIHLRLRLRISVYDDPRYFSDAATAQLASWVRAERLAVPPILLRYVTTLPFHGTVPSQPDHQRLTDALHAASAEITEEVFGGQAAHRQADYVPDAVLPDPDHNVASRLTYAFFRLADQRIAAAEQAPVNHSAALIARRAGTTPDVRIVHLRVKARQARDGHRAVDWSHRWVVQMHKVRQWYPSQQQNKILLRGPYVKGPADKPFISGDVVRALTR